MLAVLIWICVFFLNRLQLQIRWRSPAQSVVAGLVEAWPRIMYTLAISQQCVFQRWTSQFSQLAFLLLVCSSAMLFINLSHTWFGQRNLSVPWHFIDLPSHDLLLQAAIMAFCSMISLWNCDITVPVKVHSPSFTHLNPYVTLSQLLYVLFWSRSSRVDILMTQWFCSAEQYITHLYTTLYNYIHVMTI